MSEILRAFVSVKLPALPELESVSKSLAAMRWPVAAVSPDKLHVTLKFLGDAPRERIPDIQRELSRVVTDQPSFELRVEQLGAFPHADRPSVIWAGLTGAEPLAAIATQLEAALEPLGFAREQRPFHPHLTLARIKGRPPRELFELLERHRESQFGAFTVRAIEFLKSDLLKEGSRYSILSSHQLV